MPPQDLLVVALRGHTRVAQDGGAVSVVALPPRPKAPEPREPRVRMWGVFWEPKGLGRRLIGTAPDLSLPPERDEATGDEWLPVHFIACRTGRCHFTAAFRQPIRPELLATAANDRQGD